MLQETHTSENCEKRWEDLANAKCYFSHGTSNSRGVATMIPKDMNVKVNNIRRDSNGRFLILEVLIEDACYVLVNTYAPTKDKVNQQLNFIDELSEILCDYLENSLSLPA